MLLLFTGLDVPPIRRDYFWSYRVILARCAFQCHQYLR